MTISHVFYLTPPIRFTCFYNILMRKFSCFRAPSFTVVRRLRSPFALLSSRNGHPINFEPDVSSPNQLVLTASKIYLKLTTWPMNLSAVTSLLNQIVQHQLQLFKCTHCISHRQRTPYKSASLWYHFTFHHYCVYQASLH